MTKMYILYSLLHIRYKIGAFSLVCSFLFSSRFFCLPFVLLPCFVFLLLFGLSNM